jgi:hypothetical protein
MADEEKTYPLFTPQGERAIIDDTRIWVDPRGYRLSDRLWQGAAYDRRAIDAVLRRGVQGGTPVLEVAKQLEEFLTPEGRVSRTRYPTGRGSGNAAARRLARTETSRAFNRASLEANAANPFVGASKWNLSGTHKDADACDDNASGHSSGLGPGEYKTGEFPRIPNHPHCRCYVTPVTAPTKDVVSKLIQGIDPQTEEPLGTSSSILQDKAGLAFKAGLIRQEDYDDLLLALARGELSPEDIAEFTQETETLLTKQARRVDIGGRVDIASYNHEKGRAALGHTNRGWTENMAPDERAAMVDYKMNHYGVTNKYLRTGEIGPNASQEGLEKRIRNMDAALSKANPLSDPLKVKRGVAFDNAKLPEDWRTMEPGSILTDKGFMSTSMKEEGAGFGEGLINKPSGQESRYAFDIYVPKGARGISTDFLTDDRVAGNEKEFLLPRNTRLLIRSIDEVTAGGFRVLAEVLL